MLASLSRQLDLVSSGEPSDLSEDRPLRGVCADPDEVRAEMLGLLAKLRAAKTMPWTQDDVEFYEVVFPQMMSNWLPEDEAAQLRLEFEKELACLEAA